MRNLKRALSLTLASVMLLGMMVVGAGAAGYKDVSDDHNVEAIEVLQAVGAMIGDEAGNFDPDANVNRAQIATIMSRLLDLKVEDFNAADIPFTDVPEWAVPFVAACYADGITSGISDTAYGSSNDVTAVQAALMMMKALGYFQYQDDFGQDWQLATIKQASEIGLFSGVTVDRTSPLTRNDVAQMALNALKSNMVSFTGEVGSVYEVNGASIRVGYKPEYTIKTSADPIYDRIDNLATTIDKPTGQYEMQLGEYLYGGDLKLISTTDVFGRPSRYWEFEGDEVGTYVKEELLKTQYTTSVTGKALYDLLGSATLKEYELNVTIDGESDPEVFGGYPNKDYDRQDYYTIFNATHLNRNNDKAVGGTGNGVLTQVFVDTNDKTVYIAVINTYLAKADDDYDEKKEQVGLDVYDIVKDAYVRGTYIKSNDDKDSYSENITVTAEEFDIADVADGDAFLVTVADGAIQSMKTPDVLSGVEITSFSKGNSLTTDGTKYDYADTLRYHKDTLERWTGVDEKVNLKDLTYDVYLDQYGYAIGVKESEAPKNYMFITGVNGNFNNLVNINLEANAIFLDGTMETIRINGRKSDFEDAYGKLDLGVDAGATVNRWFTYTKSSSGVYNVTLVDYGVDGKTGQFHENRDGITAQNTIDYKKHNVMVKPANDLYDPEILPKDAAHVVYSNDDTVFLTVGLDNLNTSADHYAAVISDVESVSVGIDNVDITPWDHDTVENMNKSKGDPSWKVNDNDGEEAPNDTEGKVDLWCDHSYGVYALYNSDGYIIAMVVVGQDNGTNDNLVYIDSGDVKSESYDKATEKWTWVRNAIVNGERVELVEVNDTGISLLKDMTRWNWYRVRYNAKGEVTGVSAHIAHDADCKYADNDCLDLDTDYKSDWRLNTPPYAYVTNYKDWEGGTLNPGGENAIYEAINATGVNVVLYHEEFYNQKPENSGHTLYLTTNDKEASGVRYTENTNVVFIQTERNKTYTEWWKGQSGVEKAIKALHLNDKYEKNDNYSYEVSVTWKDGRATAIIIRDLNDQGTDGWWDATREGDIYFEDTNDMDWEARYLSILDGANTEVTDQGRARFFFHMVYRPDGKTNTEIFDGDGNDDDEITYRYKMFAEKDGKIRQIGSTYDGLMVLDKNEKAKFVYKGEVPVVDHVFSSNEKLYIAIVEVFNGTKLPDGTNPGLPVETDDTNMPDNVDPAKITFEGENDSSTGNGKLDDANQGEKVKITIPVPAKGKAVGSLVEGDLENGKSYYVKVNGVNDGPATLTGGKLVVTHTITAADIKESKKLVIQGIYENVEEPEKPVEPGAEVNKIAVTMGKVTVGEALPTPAVGTGMTAKNAVWDPADAKAEYGKTYTLTFTVTLDDEKAEWAEKVDVTGLKGATTIVDSMTGVVTVTYTVSTEADPAQSISSVTVSELPAEIFVGDEVTVSVTAPANVTGTATVDTKATGEVTVELEITADHEKGFAAGLAIDGWEVKNGPVSEGDKTATLTKTVTVKEKTQITEVDTIAFGLAEAVTIGETLPAPSVTTEGLKIVDGSAKWMSGESADTEVNDGDKAIAETKYTLTFNVAIADGTTHAWKDGEIAVTGPKDGTTTTPATDNKDKTYAVTYTVTTGKDEQQPTTYTYNIVIGSETLTWTSDAADIAKGDVVFTSGTSEAQTAVAAGNYLVAGDIADGYVAKAGATTFNIATVKDKDVTIPVTDELIAALKKADVTLVPVVEITVADKAGLSVIVGTDTNADALSEGAYYFVKDTEVTFSLKDDQGEVWKVVDANGNDVADSNAQENGFQYTPAADGNVTFLKAIAAFELKSPNAVGSSADGTVKAAMLADATGVDVDSSVLADNSSTTANTLKLTLKAAEGYYFAEAITLTDDGQTQNEAGYYKITDVTESLDNGDLVVIVTHETDANQ